MNPNPNPVLTYGQLQVGGLSDVDIRARVREGSLTRIRRGAYCLSEDVEPEAAHLRLLSATLPGVHPSNVVSHQSAACLHGLPVPRSSLDAVAMTRRTSGHGSASKQLKVYDTPLHAEDVTVVDGNPVTTLARTASDLARTQPYPWGVAACDAALGLGVDPEDLAAVMARHRRLKGLPVARMAAAFADARSQSPGESISRVQFARHGVPTPQLQFPVVNDVGLTVATVDFAWPELMLVGEMDGQWKYGSLLKPGQSPEQAIMNEKRREEAIREAGYWIVRWDWDMALDRIALAKRVLRVLEQQRRRLAS